MTVSYDRKVRRGRGVIGCAGMVISLVYLVEALELPAGSLARPGAAVFPYVVGAGMFVSSALVVAESIRKGGAGDKDETYVPQRGDLRRAGWILAGTSAVVLLMPLLGIFAAAAVFISVSIRHIGGRPWRVSATAGALISMAIYLLFATYLRVPLPDGIFG